MDEREGTYRAQSILNRIHSTQSDEFDIKLVIRLLQSFILVKYEDMEHEAVQRRSSATIKNMGVNSYSQIISAFRAQGDLTEDQLNILPVLQNTLGISRERHTAEIKRALYDEQLSGIAASINPSSDTTNWEVEADYNCPTIVHRPPDSKSVQFAEHVLQTTPPTAIIQHPTPLTTTKLNHDLQQLVNDERKHDGITNATQQQPSPPVYNIVKPTSTNTDLSGSKVIRLVRAKQPTKRKSSLDTLIEVVQKELLRVNGQSSSTPSPPSPPSQARLLSASKLESRLSQSTITPHRSFISSVLPSSHPASLTSQSNHSFKITRKRGTMNFHSAKRLSSLPQRNRSFNNDEDEHDFMNNADVDETQCGPENIEEIVRETVDQLVAITIVNTAPYVVNMLTTVPNNGNGANPESRVLPNIISTYNSPMIRSQSTMSKPDYYRTDLTSMSTNTNDLRQSMQQISPMKLPPPALSQQPQQPQIHHSQLIIQPATSAPMSTLQGAAAPTLLVAPRIINFQTVVPKPTTNIQIGNTKIILVSPSNITQHQPHSTSSLQPMTASAAQQQSPVKLVKFTTANNNSNTTALTTRATTLPIGTTQGSTLTLPKNVQIVIPSQTPSTIQLTRTHNDNGNKSMSAGTAFRPMTTAPMTLTTCAVDHIPQAAQEVTVTTSPTSSPPLASHTPDLPPQASLGTPANVLSSSSSKQSSNHGTSQQSSFLTNAPENNQNTHAGSTVGKLRRRSSSSAPTDKPVGKILRPIAKVLPVYSPNSSNTHNHASVTDSTAPSPSIQQQPSILNVTAARTSPTNDDMIKSVAMNFQAQQIQRPPSTHGPMIYRMTSVNPNVPVFRVRATTAPTSTTVINRSIKPDVKPISVTAASNMCYEPKPAHNSSTAGGSVSVLACFKTTKKRNKERAIMPRPSATDLNDASSDLLQQQRSQTPATSNPTIVLTSDIPNSHSSPDYRSQTSLTPTRLVRQTSLSSTISDDMSPNILSLSTQEQTNDTTTSSSFNSIPISRNNPVEPNSVKVTTTPNVSPPSSPLHSTPKPVMEDKFIQCIDNDPGKRQSELVTTDDEQLFNKSRTSKRSADDDHWTIAADSLLRDILLQESFQSLADGYQENLSTEFQRIQSNLATGVFSSKSEFQNEVLNIRQKFLENKSSDNHLEQLFDYLMVELAKLDDETNGSKRLRRD